MGLPTKVKTWQLSKNNTIAAGASVLATCQSFMRTLKNQLIGFGSAPWTVVGSCNSVAAGLDGVDRWASDSNLVWSGTTRSWIVLKQTGIASNFQMCIDLNSGNAYQISVICSLSAGFTGGSTSARPTATDEYVAMSVAQFMRSTAVQQQLNVWQSTDGACMRVVGMSSGGVTSSFLHVEKPINVVSGWTNPNIAYGNGADASGSGPSSLNNFFGALNAIGRGSGNFNIAYAGEANTSGVLLARMANVGDVVNSFDGGFPFFPVSIYSNVLNNRGRHATLADLYWLNNNVAIGDVFNSAAQMDWAALGVFIFPWDGSTVGPALT